MTAAKALDRNTQGPDAVQTGVRFGDSQNHLQATQSKARNHIRQLTIVEVCKSLGSAANE